MPIIKIQFNEDIRRKSFEIGVPGFFNELQNQISVSFQIPKEKELTLKYFDGEDNCLIASEAELEEAFQVCEEKKTILKIIVTLNEDQKANAVKNKRVSDQAERYFCTNEPQMFPVLNFFQRFFLCFVGFFRCLFSYSRHRENVRSKARIVIGAFFLAFIVFHSRFILKSVFYTVCPIVILLILLFLLLTILFFLFKVLFKLLSYASNQIERARELHRYQSKMKKEKKEFFNAKAQSPIPSKEQSVPKERNNFELFEKYSKEIESLRAMGFVNSLRNLQLLESNHGDMNATILQLLSK